MKATIRTSRQTVKVTNDGGHLNAHKPVTLKNTINEIDSITDINDVEEPELVDGATLVYNANTQKFEVRILELGEADADIDGGTY